MCIYLKEMISTYKDIGIAYISSSLKASGNNVILRYPFVNEIDYEEIKEFAPDYIGLTVYDIMFFKKPEMLKNKHFRLFLFLVCF